MAPASGTEKYVLWREFDEFQHQQERISSYLLVLAVSMIGNMQGVDHK